MMDQQMVRNKYVIILLVVTKGYIQYIRKIVVCQVQEIRE